MQISKTMEYCGNDRLSELHDSLIFNIFQLMPTLDVVKTTTLSKRWKNLWTTVPWLDFDDTTMKDRDKFRDFVNGALDSWRGAKILSFHVKFDSDLWKSVTHDDIDSWLLFATKNNVEDLKLHLPEPHNERSYLAPDCLYSCSSLKNVYLLGCDLQVDGNLVQWDQLRSLWIRCHRADAINLVLSGSPKLEYLFLFLRRSMSNENLSIRSSSLKHLLIVRASLMDLELRIWTPKLERLTIVGFPFSKCLMMNVSPLTEANLFLYDTIHFGGGMVPQILPALEHVERVHLNDWCIEVRVYFFFLCLLFILYYTSLYVYTYILHCFTCRRL